jgi:preprotein translocase subunit SecG
MYGVLLTFHIIVSLLLILIVLMQQRGGGLSSVFGGESIFGGRGANPFLTKTTIVLFIIFILTSFNLVLLTKSRETRRVSAIRKTVEKGEMPSPPYKE